MGESEDDEFSRPNGGDADFDNHQTFKNVLSCHSSTKADIDEVSIFRFTSLQGALLPEAIEITLNHPLYLEPGGGVVRLEYSKVGRFLY